MFYEMTINNRVYRLRLTVKNMVALERRLGMNPLMLFGADGSRIPTVDELLAIFHYSLIDGQHSLSLDDSAQLFQEWLDEGHIVTDFVPVIVEIYQNSGLIKKNPN